VSSRVLLAILCLGVWACSQTSHPSLSTTYKRPTVRLYAYERFKPTDGPDCNGSFASETNPAATVKPLSPSVKEQIDRATQLYDQQRLNEARKLIEPVYQAEPENHFVIDAYARILFRMNDRVRSFEVYSKLINMLDTRRTCKNEIVIDFWFIEAYWKKGILHLDRGEWREAAYEISRAYAGMNEPAIVDQALSYLTEGFFNLGDYEVARYYAAATLQHNPQNKYVQKYIDHMNKVGKT
jgi:tetratricopeptide (TPR) repeat protein